MVRAPRQRKAAVVGHGLRNFTSTSEGRRAQGHVGHRVVEQIAHRQRERQPRDRRDAGDGPEEGPRRRLLQVRRVEGVAGRDVQVDAQPDRSRLGVERGRHVERWTSRHALAALRRDGRAVLGVERAEGHAPAQPVPGPRARADLYAAQSGAPDVRGASRALRGLHELNEVRDLLPVHGRGRLRGPEGDRRAGVGPDRAFGRQRRVALHAARIPEQLLERRRAHGGGHVRPQREPGRRIDPRPEPRPRLEPQRRRRRPRHRSERGRLDLVPVGHGGQRGCGTQRQDAKRAFHRRAEARTLADDGARLVHDGDRIVRGRPFDRQKRGQLDDPAERGQDDRCRQLPVGRVFAPIVCAQPDLVVAVAERRAVGARGDPQRQGAHAAEPPLECNRRQRPQGASSGVLGLERPEARHTAFAGGGGERDLEARAVSEPRGRAPPGVDEREVGVLTGDDRVIVGVLTRPAVVVEVEVPIGREHAGPRPQSYETHARGRRDREPPRPERPDGRGRAGRRARRRRAQIDDATDREPAIERERCHAAIHVDGLERVDGQVIE